MFHHHSEENLNTLRRELLQWYETEYRNLPWRETNDPYRIWISEIMLQQTQVKTVLPYFNNFIRRFPTVYDLACASIDEVLKLWEGLGYYARARNLHRTAQRIITEFGGQFPRDLSRIKQLPGIGPYTAAAILSIAFGADHAVVDGNVQRVLARLYQVDKPVQSAEGKQQLEELAQRLLARGQAGQYNQAIMELGALICTPRKPICEKCPLNRFCQSYSQATQDRYPIKEPRRKRPHVDVAAGIIWKGQKVLIAKRPEQGLLGGLWEFPGGKIRQDETASEAVLREIREELDILVRVGERFMTVNHEYTHFTLTMDVFHCTYVSGKPKALGCSAWKWVPKRELPQYAFPRATGKVLDKLLS